MHIVKPQTKPNLPSPTQDPSPQRILSTSLFLSTPHSKYQKGQGRHSHSEGKIIPYWGGYCWESHLIGSYSFGFSAGEFLQHPFPVRMCCSARFHLKQETPKVTRAQATKSFMDKYHNHEWGPKLYWQQCSSHNGGVFLLNLVIDRHLHFMPLVTSRPSSMASSCRPSYNTDKPWFKTTIGTKTSITKQCGC